MHRVSVQPESSVQQTLQVPQHLRATVERDCGFSFTPRALWNPKLRSKKVTDESKQAAEEVGCFRKLAEIINVLPDPSDAEYEAKARECLQELLRLDKKKKVMDLLDKLKHIRRELNVILEVVTEQRNVIKQMTDDLEAGELKVFKCSDELKERRSGRANKLEKRREQIIALDRKADNIYKDVSNPSNASQLLSLTDKARTFYPSEGTTGPQPTGNLLQPAC